MILRSKAILLSLMLTIVAATPAWTASALKALDPDKDGTVDLVEALNAASAVFDRLDRDRDGTLDARELRGRLSAKQFAAANWDGDGTMDRFEFLGLVHDRFYAANPDFDGTIDARELASPAGRALLRLLR